MINWKRCSYDQIQKKWREFKQTRIKKHDAMKSNDEKQITGLERESLIDDLLTRLDYADRVIKSYTRFKKSIEE